jgi:hypothetical protein
MTLDEKITEAETALHRLLIGAAEVEVGYEDGRIRYTAANRADLEGYIARLKAERDGKPARGAVGIRF